MNSQSAAQTDADEQASSSPCEESSNTGADAKTSSTIVKSYRTKQLFFHFEIGVTKTRTQPGGASSQASPPMRQPAGVQPVLVGAPKPQPVAAMVGAPAPADPMPMDIPSANPSSSTSTVHVTASVGVTDMPPVIYPGPPKS